MYKIVKYQVKCGDEIIAHCSTSESASEAAADFAKTQGRPTKCTITEFENNKIKTIKTEIHGGV